MGKPHPKHEELLQRLFRDLASAAALLKAHPELVHSCDSSGETPFHVAIAEGNLKAAQLLLDHKADVNARDHGGKPPLHAAAIGGHPEVVTFLLSKGADAAAEDENFDTALHFALWAEAPSTAIVDALLAAGADPRKLNSLEESPIDIAEEKNLDDILSKLKAAG